MNKRPASSFLCAVALLCGGCGTPPGGGVTTSTSEDSSAHTTASSSESISPSATVGITAPSSDSTAVNIILDTDLGCDCDDIGALAVLHSLEQRGEAHILGVTHCTSAPGGAICVDAVNRYFGRGNIPVGRLTDTDLLADPQNDVYGSAVAQALRYTAPADGLPDATATLRRVLAQQPDNSVVLVAVGPLRNIAHLLTSAPDAYSPLNGVELVGRTVKELVIMGGCFVADDHPLYIAQEYNILCDVKSAQTVVERCPVPLVFSGFEIGHQLLTGGQLFKMRDPNNPVWYGYNLHTRFSYPDEPVTTFSRPSWDQSCVLYAVRGEENDFRLSQPGVISIDDTGATTFRSTPNGTHRYIRSLPLSGVTTATIDQLMLALPPVP